jgi:hypothetical protein
MRPRKYVLDESENERNNEPVMRKAQPMVAHTLGPNLIYHKYS